MRWHSWRRRPGLTPPPPDRSGVVEASRAAREAAEGFRRALQRDPEVQERAARAERIYRENSLGPSFWRLALEGQSQRERTT